MPLADADEVLAAPLAPIPAARLRLLRTEEAIAAAFRENGDARRDLQALLVAEIVRSAGVA